ncbi:MAG: TonB family protein [Agarilytica sp.]
MSSPNYTTLASNWIPDSHEKKTFYIIVAISLALAFALAIVVASVEVPPKERKARSAPPERVAKFITQKKKVEPPKPKPTPVPTPKVIPTPKPKVVRKKETEAEKKKPLTKKEKKARDTAAKSGLLALTGELADLMDTSSVDKMVGAKTKKASSDATKVAGVSSDVLTSDAGKGSGGVSTSDYVSTNVGSTSLSQRDIALVKQSLLKSDQVEGDDEGDRARSGNVRTEEEVTIVFDQNKGQLFSIYNRERRKNPSLKGKLVLEITIAPDGSVTAVKIASSELNDPKLERRIIARVKRFKFQAKNVEPVTVTFPIEFLPS